MWGHILSFLGGPRACIGYRFSLIEYVAAALIGVAVRPLTARLHRMKALIFTLVRAFEFELAVPAEDIQKKSAIVQRPLLRSAPKDGSQMPLLMRRYKRA